MSIFPSLFFTVDIKHSNDLAAVLRGNGVKAYPISGNTPDDQELNFYRWFREGEIDGMTSCGVLVEGADHPNAVGAFMCRDTKSGLLYRQMVGRVMRPFPAPLGDRPYQRDCLGEILASLQDGVNLQLAVLPTGTGKTRISTDLCQVIEQWKHRRCRRQLFLVHRDNLVQQAAESYSRWHPELRVGIEAGGGRYAGDADVVVASVASLGQARIIEGDEPTWEYNERLRGLNPDDFDSVTIDECFIPGTMVDNEPIEKVCMGQYVSSFDHAAGAIVHRRVKRKVSRKTKTLTRLTFSDGTQEVCTPNHPFYLPTVDNYVMAKFLRIGCMVLCTNQRYTQWDGRTNLRELPGSRWQTRHSQPQAPLEKDGQVLLLGRVPGSTHGQLEFGKDGQDQPEVCLGENAGTQPNALSGNTGEGQDQLAGDGLGAYGSRGKRDWANLPPAITGVLSGVGYRSGGEHREVARDAELLQDRHRESHLEDSYRSGREYAQHDAGASPGCEENSLLGILRLDRIEVLEPGGTGEFERLCPDGLVYDLEVEEHHNYFANGILVHNCHHGAKGKYYHNILRYFGLLKGYHGLTTERLLLGITATPNRSDNVGLECLCDKIVFEYGIRDAIKAGYLADIHAYRVETDVDISHVSTRAGDFNLAELEETVNTRERNELIAREYLRIRDLIRPDLESNVGHKPYCVVVDIVDVTGRHSIVTAPTLFGLREKFDLKGGSAIATSDEVEREEEENPGLDLSEADDLEAVRERVRHMRSSLHRLDLLSPSLITREVREASRFNWLKDGPGSYFISLTTGELMTVREDALGGFSLSRHKKGIRTKVGTFRNLKEAFSNAERQIPDSDRALLLAAASWREHEPTEKQATMIMIRHKAYSKQFRGSASAFFAYAMGKFQEGDMRFSRGGLSSEISRLDVARR